MKFGERIQVSDREITPRLETALLSTGSLIFSVGYILLYTRNVPLGIALGSLSFVIISIDFVIEWNARLQSNGTQPVKEFAIAKITPHMFFLINIIPVYGLTRRTSYFILLVGVSLFIHYLLKYLAYRGLPEALIRVDPKTNAVRAWDSESRYIKRVETTAIERRDAARKES